MKSVFKRTVSAFLSLLFVLLLFISCSTVSTATGNDYEGPDYYGYGYWYLGTRLQRYGTADNNGYYFAKMIQKDDNNFRHYFDVSYNINSDDLTCTYICDYVNDNEQFEDFFTMIMTIPKSNPYSFEVLANYQYMSADIFAKYNVNPTLYTPYSSLNFELRRGSFEGPIVTDNSAQEVLSTALGWGTSEWNNILYDEIGMTLGNFGFYEVANPNYDIYPPIYTVSFNSNGIGTPPSNIKIFETGLLSYPGNLYANGYTFKGWFKEPKCINEWDFDNDRVTSDITLYAKWEKNSSAGDDTPDHTHTFGSKWKSDKNNHWKECECGQKSNNEAHKYNSGTVTKSATATETGIKTFTCTVCGYKKTETIPISGTDKVAKVKISAPTGTKTINWKYKARLVATATGLPAGYHIAWYEGGTKVSDSADFTTASLTSAHTLTARIVDEMGNAVSTPAQEKTVTIEVKDDFFTKIISFFSRLFGSDVVKV